MDTLSASAVPKHGVSRRAQNKRTMHARFPAALAAGPPAKRPCLKLPARRAATAPSKPAETECSDMSSHTTDGETLNKASSCPPLNEGLLPAEGAPLTPRLLSLPPAAAVPAASKSPTPPRTSPIPESASSGTAPACAAAAAAVADTAATPAFGATSSPAVSAAVAPLHGLMAPPPGLAPISAPMAVPAVVASLLPAPAYTSSPVTPNVATPPPETPRTKARAGAGRGRSNGRAGSAEPRAGGYKGRFCGRLFLKEDEAKLALECQLTGHLLGCGSGNGDDSARHTLAKIVRDIASGAVREHCEKRERCMQELEAQQQQMRRLAVENEAMRAQLGLLPQQQRAPKAAAAKVATPAAAAATDAVSAAVGAAAAASAAAAAAAAAAAKSAPVAAPRPVASAAMAAAMAASAAARAAASSAPRISAPPPPAFHAPPSRLPSLQLSAGFAAAFPGVPAAPSSLAATSFTLSPLASPAAAHQQGQAQQGCMAALAQAQVAQAQAQMAQLQAQFQQQRAAQQQLPMRQMRPVTLQPPASPFAASARSAFAPVAPSLGRSPSAEAAGAFGGGISRPTAAVGVPPVALHPPPTRV